MRRDNDDFVSYERNVALYDDERGTANCVESRSRSGGQCLGVELVDGKQNGSAHRGDNVRSSDTLCRALHKRDGHRPRLQYLVFADCVHVWASRRSLADRSDLQVDVSQTAGGWYVSGVKTEN